MKALLTVRCEKCGKWALKVSREAGKLKYEVAGQTIALLRLHGKTLFPCRTFECQSRFSVSDADLSACIEDAEKSHSLTVFAKAGRETLRKK